MKDVMSKEKSYDSLPNFAAADCKFFLMNFGCLVSRLNKNKLSIRRAIYRTLVMLFQTVIQFKKMDL